MYLKRLELQGFKSFPEKIKLEFNKGITAVVGPNGSGKSNIADAVRWVLGEKSAKSLRGAKMEDVIFAGTQNRKPLGFAEVSMIIDNSDGKMNIDFSEVTITRKVYRTGESDYYINNVRCRLKDVLELFMDTGVGKEGYSIIGQGRIDEILSTKSEDRRLLFEEAAGIVKYKTRRIEAGNRLNKERENLVRVNDIISELEAQVGPLEIQAQKAKEYIVLADRLKLVQVNIFVHEADKFEKAVKELDNSIGDLRAQIIDEEDNKALIDRNKNDLKEELAKTEALIEKRAEELAERRGSMQEREGMISLNNQEIEHLKGDIERIENENKDNLGLVDSKNEEITLINSQIKAKELEIHQKKSDYEVKSKAFQKLNAKMSEREESLNRFNADILTKLNNKTDINNKIGGYSALLEQFVQRKAAVDESVDVAEGLLEEKRVYSAVLEKDMERLYKEAEVIASNLERLNEKYDSLNDEIAERTDKEAALSTSISEKGSRYKLLNELEKSYEGYYEGVKAILKQRDTKANNFKGICCAVGEAITLEEKYETAIEVALGSSIQHIIVKTEEDVKEAIGYLKKSNSGRATFLPLTAIKARSFGSEKHSVLSQKGVIGTAKELIRYNKEYESVFSSLLEKVVVVDNLDNAIRINKKFNYAYKVVTLEGDLLNVGGSVTGGSVSKKTTGVFSRTREISALKEELDKLYESQKQNSEALDKAKELFENVSVKIDECKEAIHEIDIDKSEVASKIESVRAEVEQLEARLNNVNIEKRQLDEQLLDVRESIEDYNEQLKQLDEEIENINLELDKYQSQIQEDRDAKDAGSKELTEIQLDLSRLENAVYSFNSDVSRLSGEIESVNARIKVNNREIKNIRMEIEIVEGKIEKLNDEMQKDRAGFEKLKTLREADEKKKLEINQSIEKADEDFMHQLELISRLNNEMTRLEARKEQLEQKTSALYNAMWEDYEITYVAAKEYERLEVSGAELQKEERSLKGRIKALGSVNVGAVEEYKQVKERFDFLSNQRNDILEAEERLEKIIQELEGLMEKQFSEQFKVMSENFSVVFAEMFGGGKASLKLSDENDVLNSGIDIIAQPPGKALQNMLLLSGGERALTAMALLFAILRMKPSPFCILDEIEAALDDANVNRYAAYLQKLTAETQFIIITHRKGTMEAADILYGVTMQEQGVSKLVSVDFSEEENKDLA